jgi:membrane-bound lytic murein transglycosylase D
MNIKRYFVYLLLPFCAAALIAGCAPSAKNITAAKSADEKKTAVESEPQGAALIAEPDPTAPEPTEEEPVPEIVDVAQLVKSARQACADSLFGAADSMLKKAAAYLARGGDRHVSYDSPADLHAGASTDMSDDAPVDLSADMSTGENEGDAPSEIQDYVAEIVAIYADLMPPTYPMPDDVSFLIFNRHLLESLLDSVKISAEDSVFLARLINKTETVYDMPIVWNNRVRRALLFYIRTRKGGFDRWLHRAGYYLPPMKQMFSDSGLPTDLAYLPIIESGFNPQAYSRARAAGIWQFIPSTGRNYGLRQNYWLDERRDPLKATEAAINYLRKLYGDFGNWHIALASYNCGENGMARSIRKSGGVYDYWSLKLPKETMNYIPLYLAALIIAKNADVFDFAIQDSVVFNPDTVSVSDCIEMSAIAEGIDVPLDTLKWMNPHILHWCTPPDLQNVRLYLPKGYADAFNIFYSELPDEKKTKFYRYKIRHGDNLLQIARNFRVPVEALREMNKMRNNYISVGKFLIIPIPVNDSVPASLAAYLNQSDREKPTSSRNRGRAAPRTGQKVTYKVHTGETLYSIAKLFNVSVQDLMSWNYLANARSLKAEQTLVIYRQDGTQSVSPVQQRVRGNPSEYTGKRMVRQGDTLYGIAMELGLTVNELARINGLDTRRPKIFPGDVLVYTPKAGAAARVTE